ncbi:hypothetical protein FOZ63_011067, partial [Perkinsus olseni]
PNKIQLCLTTVESDSDGSLVVGLFFLVVIELDMSNSTASFAGDLFTSLSEGELASILRAYATSGPDVGNLLQFVNSTRPDLLEPEDPAGYIRYSILVVLAILTSTTVLVALIVVFGTH